MSDPSEVTLDVRPESEGAKIVDGHRDNDAQLNSVEGKRPWAPDNARFGMLDDVPENSTLQRRTGSNISKDKSGDDSLRLGRNGVRQSQSLSSMKKDKVFVVKRSSRNLIKRSWIARQRLDPGGLLDEDFDELLEDTAEDFDIESHGSSQMSSAAANGKRSVKYHSSEDARAAWDKLKESHDRFVLEDSFSPKILLDAMTDTAIWWANLYILANYIFVLAMQIVLAQDAKANDENSSNVSSFVEFLNFNATLDEVYFAVGVGQSDYYITSLFFSTLTSVVLILGFTQRVLVHAYCPCERFKLLRGPSSSKSPPLAQQWILIGGSIVLLIWSCMGQMHILGHADMSFQRIGEVFSSTTFLLRFYSGLCYFLSAFVPIANASLLASFGVGTQYRAKVLTYLAEETAARMRRDTQARVVLQEDSDIPPLSSESNQSHYADGDKADRKAGNPEEIDLDKGESSEEMHTAMLMKNWFFCDCRRDTSKGTLASRFAKAVRSLCAPRIDASNIQFGYWLDGHHEHDKAPLLEEVEEKHAWPIVRFSLDVPLMSICVIQFLLTIGLMVSLDYLPSAIPLVSIVTLHTVCSDKDDAGFSYCDPNVYPRAWQRAIGSSVLVIVEFVVIVLFCRVYVKALPALDPVMYNLNRRNQLGLRAVRFLVVFSLCIYVVAMATAIATFPEVYWIIAFDSPNGKYHIDPLHKVGIFPATPTYNLVMLVYAAFWAMLALFFLPKKDPGIRPDVCCCPPSGPFCGCCDCLQRMCYYGEDKLLSAAKRLEATASSLHMLESKDCSSDDNCPSLQLLVTEQEHKLYLKCNSLPVKDIRTAMASRTGAIVLETEVLSLNASDLSYRVGDTENALSQEELMDLVEDKRKLCVQHIVDRLSDTHVVVVVYTDRILVAFRGTVSLKNWGTDFSLSLVPEPRAFDIKPVHEGLQGSINRFRSSRYAAKTPKYHSGFLKCYNAISDRLQDFLWPLLFEAENDGTGIYTQQRPLFITGHSLGGGLAGIAALDLALWIKAKIASTDRPIIAMNTFGCPRSCNYSFRQRLMRVVPKVHRYVLQGDPITNTPFNVFSSYDGYHHVGNAILLDLRGNMIVKPSLSEIYALHVLRRPTARHHFLTQYCLAFALCYGRMHNSSISADFFWNKIISKMIKLTKREILALPQFMKRELLGITLREGVSFPLKSGVTVTSHSTDTSEDNPQVPLADTVTGRPSIGFYPSNVNTLKDADHGGSDAINSQQDSGQSCQREQLQLLMAKIKRLRASDDVLPSTLQGLFTEHDLETLQFYCKKNV